jgi:hypothetical protein
MGRGIVPASGNHAQRGGSMRSLILWLIGIPIPIIILLWFFM